MKAKSKSKQSNNKSKSLLYADSKSLLYGRKKMSKAKKQTEEQKAIALLKSLSYDQLAIVTAKADTEKKAKASKMSEKEKLERLSGHDTKIKSLENELSIYRGLRRKLAKELGMIEVIKASRNATAIWNLEFTKQKKGLRVLVTKAGSTKKAFTHIFKIDKRGNKNVVTKASRKEGYDQLAIHYGIDTESKQYNNVATNNWLKAMVAFCSDNKIEVERKNMQ